MRTLYLVFVLWCFDYLLYKKTETIDRLQ